MIGQTLRFDSIAVLGPSRDGPPRKEAPVKTHPRRSLLRKIAARRARSARPDAPGGWLTLAAGAPAGSARHARGLGLLGPRILTPRELEVLRLVAHGETDQRIADRLYLSRRTVNSHVSHILAKLDVPTRRVAVITAARIGLL
jgi:DNA-binding CsgD family transcriptional regulator